MRNYDKTMEFLGQQQTPATTPDPDPGYLEQALAYKIRRLEESGEPIPEDLEPIQRAYATKTYDINWYRDRSGTTTKTPVVENGLGGFSMAHILIFAGGVIVLSLIMKRKKGGS